MPFAAVHRDEVFLSEPILEQVLSLLADIHDTGEDCAVWHGQQVGRVRHGIHGRIAWLAAEAA